MSVHKSKKELDIHKEEALKTLNNYIDKLITSEDEKLQDKADKISYWFEDYAKFLDFETSFDTSKFPKYKKGQIIKVHLGFNIGSEEGGLHYAIVIENNNSVKSPVLNIVPLTSVKSTTDVSKIRKDLGQVYLGNELYRLLNAKVSALQTSISAELSSLEKIITSLSIDSSQIKTSKERLNKCKKELEILKKTEKEISKMKIGSIALVGQITTISKIRIYDPKNTRGVLSGIRVSNETLDKIDEVICQLFTKPIKRAK